MKKTTKIPYEYVLYFFQTFFIAIFVLVLLAYNLDIAQKSFLERRMFSANVKGIQMGDARIDKGVMIQIPKDENIEFMIYKFLVDENKIVRGVYGTSDIFGYSKYIAEGRFFTQDDYKGKKPTVVIGQNILAQTYEENGKRYYGYNQQLYEVIGVFRCTDTVLDKTIYLNLPYLLKNENHMGLYYIDAEKPSIVSKVISEMISYADNRYKTMPIEYQSNVTYIGLGRANHALLTFAVLSTFFNMCITLIFFVTHKQYKVAIQKLCGMTSKNLAWIYGRDILAILILSFLTVLLIINNLSRYLGDFFTLEKLEDYHFVLMGVVLMLLGIVTTLFTVKTANRVNISSSLKAK